MGQRADFIKVARAEVGVIEGPKDNETKYGAFTKANFLPWCGSFVMWCANEVGLKIPNVVGTLAGAQSFLMKNNLPKGKVLNCWSKKTSTKGTALRKTQSSQQPKE